MSSFLIQLVAGVINIVFNIEGATLTLKSQNKTYYDGDHHMIKFEIKENMATMVIDEEEQQTASNLKRDIDQWFNTLYMGGLPMNYSNKANLSDNLMGCFSHLTINNHFVSLHHFKDAEGITFSKCHDEHLHCIRMDNGSIPIILKNTSKDLMPLTFSFKTEDEEGFIFQLNSEIGTVSLLIRNQKIIVWLKYISSLNKDKIINITTVSQHWHSVLIQELEKSLIMVIDDEIFHMSTSLLGQDTSQLSLHLGGYTTNLESFIKEKIFNGSIKNLRISTKLHDMRKFVVSNRLHPCCCQ